MNEGIMVVILILSIINGIAVSKSSKVFLLVIAPALVGVWAFFNLDQANMILTIISSCVITGGAFAIGKKL